jgi:hypothetical protein
LLDEAKLAQVGLPWFAPTNMLYSIGSNLAIGATITHVAVWYGKEIYENIQAYRRGEAYDPHLAKMKVYPEVPMWWYGLVFLASFAMVRFVLSALPFVSLTLILGYGYHLHWSR